MLDAGKAQELLAKKIDTCKKRGFLPLELIDLVENIYARQLQARGKARIPSIAAGETADALQQSQGAPLVERTRFPFDREQSLELFHEFLQLAKLVNPALAEACKTISTALEDTTLDLDVAMTAHLRGDEGFFATWAAKTPSAPRVLPMLVQAAMTPSFERVAEELESRRDDSVTWAHGHCPICGSMPIMTDLREKEGFRYNICGFCHGEYRVTRLQCPFCLEKDTAKLAYYEAEEEPGLRINACTTCGMYIKQTDFRNLDRKSLPLIDDLESLTLDVVARDKKFKRPTLSAWGF
jgi:FdhE protein